jgi:hypothetical protein
VKHDLVRGLKNVIFEKDKLCSVCQAGKQVGNTHPKKSIMSTSKAFELLYMDLFGPTTYTSIGGNKYGFVIVDDFIRYTWIVFLVDKSDVFATFKSFIKRVYNEFGKMMANEFEMSMIGELLPWSSNQAFEEWYICESRQVHQRHAQKVWYRGCKEN